jgi:hypothetical protein
MLSAGMHRGFVGTGRAACEAIQSAALLLGNLLMFSCTALVSLAAALVM